MRFSLINSSLICQLYSLFIFHNFYRREINILIPHNSHSTIIRFLFSLFWLKETVDHDSKVLWFHEFCTKFNFVYGSLLGWRASEALSVHVLLFFSLSGSSPWPHCVCCSCWLLVWLWLSVLMPGEIKSGQRLKVLQADFIRALCLSTHSYRLRTFPLPSHWNVMSLLSCINCTFDHFPVYCDCNKCTLSE